MLQRDISACRTCLFRVDLLPLMLAKMCQLCLLGGAMAKNESTRCFCGQKRMYLKVIAGESVVGRI